MQIGEFLEFHEENWKEIQNYVKKKLTFSQTHMKLVVFMET